MAAKELRSAVRSGVQSRRQNSSPKILQFEEKISEWLGNETKLIINKSGDSVLLSHDGTRKVRFDFNHPAPHTHPHAHIEEMVKGKWNKSGPTYPKDIPHY